MAIIKTAEEVALMRISSLLVSQTLTEVAKILKAGITTLVVDELVGTFIKDNGAIPSFKGYHGYPFNACISVNDAVVHGFPNNEVLQDGDIVSVDVGVFKNGFHGDSAYTFIIGNTSDAIINLIKVTKESLYLGISKAKVNSRVGDIGFAIQEHCEHKHKYGVVRDLVGHGLGRNLHEDPQVPNYGKRGNGPKLKAGTTIAIEPMINLGTKDVYTMKDGWTIKTKDGQPSAHFEHNIVVQQNEPEILSDFNIIENAEKLNTNLLFVH
jgi:methionyl aminopeptidase